MNNIIELPNWPDVPEHVQGENHHLVEDKTEAWRRISAIEDSLNSLALNSLDDVHLREVQAFRDICVDLIALSRHPGLPSGYE